MSARGFLTYADLAEIFALSAPVLRRRMREWDDFPAPLPWSRNQKRWNPDSVSAWKTRKELRAKAIEPPALHAVR